MGDSKMFLAVQASAPYGPDFHINKAECIGHLCIWKRGTSIKQPQESVEKEN